MASAVCGREIRRGVMEFAKRHSVVGRSSRRTYLTTFGSRSQCLYVDRTHVSKALPLLSVCVRHKSDDRDLNALFQPVPMMPIGTDGEEVHDVGKELVGALDKGDILRILNQFYRLPEIQRLGNENGLDSRLFHQVYISFRRFCVESKVLPVDLHVILSDIIKASGNVTDIFPYFLQHAKDIFPHLECMDDLKKISDLRMPANWYPEARSIQRKIVFHAGPTNSGKTYHALQRFTKSRSGVYCGPLRMLASEVFKKTNQLGTNCDLITGEERQYADENNEPSPHVACTVEMTSVNTPYEVAVIDEIQMMRDPQRGWAWTRAFLGVCAEEVHLCGEASAIDIIKQMAFHTGDEVEVRKYNRLTKLDLLDSAVERFHNIKPGDCIVCFNKNDIYFVSRQLERRGHECAVIYGGLPPGAKLAQAEKFNDPSDPCKVMVATDAIGMGLNLNIKRIVFYSLVKPILNEKGDKEILMIPCSTALQIAGRAGRFGTQYEAGEVTTFKKEDIGPLKKLLSTEVQPVEHAGLHPTAEQIELFAYHLPKASLSNLIDIFITLSKLDNDNYFMCNVDDFKFLADMVEHVPLSLRARYVFCCAPISKRSPFVCTMFLKFARRFSRAEPITLDWLCKQLSWPYSPPQLITDLAQLEATHDVLDLYLWLSYRFTDMFPDIEHVQDMQKELDSIIQQGVANITKLLKNSETKVSSDTLDENNETELRNRINRSRDMSEQLDGDEENVVSRPKGRNRTLIESFKDAQQDRKEKADSGQLSERLVKQGLLTKNMLLKLQEEWLAARGDLSSSSNKKSGQK